MKKYNLNPQIINTLRFSCQRFDSSRSNQIFGKNFKDLYRYVNVRMARPDEQILFNFLKLNVSQNLSSNFATSPRNTDRGTNMTSDRTSETMEFSNRTIFNLKQLDKLIDHFAKEHYRQQIKKNENKNT